MIKIIIMMMIMIDINTKSNKYIIRLASWSCFLATKALMILCLDLSQFVLGPGGGEPVPVCSRPWGKRGLGPVLSLFLALGREGARSCPGPGGQRGKMVSSSACSRPWGERGLSPVLSLFSALGGEGARSCSGPGGQRGKMVSLSTAMVGL